MEVVLNKLGNQPDLKSLEGLFDAIQKAKTSLHCPLAQCGPAEKRQKCIDCFAIALAANRPKFAAIAFEGIQLILRDHSFDGSGGDPEGQTRADQLLAMLAAIPSWRETATTQCQALTLLVQLISTEIPLKLGHILNAIEICKQTFDMAADESTNVRPAARAALTQMLNSYVQNRLSLAENGDSAEIGALMDVTALLGELVARMGAAIEEAIGQDNKTSAAPKSGTNRKKAPPQSLLLPLDALFSVLSALEPEQLDRHQPLFNALKNELLPVIIFHLHGSGRSASANQNAMDSGTMAASKRLGSLLKRATSRQSTDSAPTTAICPAGIALDGLESARSFYQVVEQLMRLFTPMALCQCANPPPPANESILFLLEELWRSALLEPPIAKRAEAVRWSKRLGNNGASFGELLLLSVASGTDSFWLILVECLEECATGADMKLAMDALRSLTALFNAISQLLSKETFPQAELLTDFYSKLAKAEGKLPLENEEGEEGEAANKNGGKLRRQSSAFPPQPEPAAKIFLDAFAEQIENWQKYQSPSELDQRIQEFSLAIFSKMDGLMNRPAAMKRKNGGRRKSGASTPEDSEEEEEEEEGEEGEEVERGGLREIDIYSLVNATILELERIGGEGEGGGGPKHDAGWIMQRSEKGEGKEIGGPNNDADVGIALSICPPAGSSREFGNLFRAILRSIRDQPQLDLPHPPDANTIFHLLASDPIGMANGGDGQENRLLLCRWFRLHLHNCWGSILRMLGQFPLRKGIGEEAKCATIEAIAAFVPLAIQLGMLPELLWAFEYIGEQVCALEELREAARRSGDDPKAARRFCGRSEILAMQVIIENALQALIVAPKTAKYAIRCVQFLWELERWHFKLAKSTIDAIYEPPVLHVPPSKSGQNSPIGQLIGATLPNVGELNSTELARLMDQFLAIVDRLFSDAPNSLPLDSLCALLSAIANANEDNLHYSGGMAPSETSAQLLQRLCKLLSATGHFPIVVKMAIWARIREHLVQCASSNTIPPEINRRAVDGLQDVLAALLHWEWGGPMPKGCHHRSTIIHGWNALLFDIFTQILEPKGRGEEGGGGDGCCTTETCQQIGQILMSFLEQNAEMVASGWPQFFSSIKLIGQRGFNESMASQATPSTPLIQLAIELLEKFATIQRPTLLIAAFPDFADALVHSINLATSAEDDRLMALLDQSERILLEYLLGSAIPLTALPRNFIESEEEKLSTKWREFGQKAKKGTEKEDDYLHLLAELRTEIRGGKMASTGDGEEEGGGGGEWPLLRKWLDGSEERGSGTDSKMDVILEEGQPPWANLAVPTDRAVAEMVLQLLAKLIGVILGPRESNRQTAKRTRLAVNAAELLKRIATEIGPNFAAFSACSAILGQFRHAIGSPLTTSSARSLKQFLGIISSHSAIIELLEGNGEEGGNGEGAPSEEWRICVMGQLVNLAIRCVAKGGTLSLAGCALLRRLCANAANSPLSHYLRPICVNSIWLASRYALFPVRMLIAQFFINSTDFSGDLGQMKVSYRLGLDPLEAEERIENVQQLANQVFRLDGQIVGHRGEEGEAGNGEEEGKGGGGGGGEDNAVAHFPAKFAYLFLFETGSGKGGGKKMSMGLDELVDSLCCQQFLVQLAGEQLLRIGGAGDKGPNCGAETMAIAGPLLATLNATLAICEQFECRPGLKSLLQKLTGLPCGANLWGLYLCASHALIRYEIGECRRKVMMEGDDGKDGGEERHLGQILHLLGAIGGQTTGKQNSPGTSPAENLDKNGKNAPQFRANPFISQQLSQESQGSKSAKAEKVRVFALGKLISLLEMDLLEEGQKKSEKELRQFLAGGIRKMIGDWRTEAEKEGERAKEMLEIFAIKLER